MKTSESNKTNGKNVGTDPNFWMQSLLVGVAALVMAGCADDGSGGATDGNQSGLNPPVVTVNALPLPNKYQVVLNWPQNPNAITWFVSRADKSDSRPLQLGTLGKDALTYTDETIQGGETYRYLLTCLESGQYRTAKEVSVTVPLDKETTEKEVVTDIKGINRLFINGGMVTNGAPLTIDVNEIITSGKWNFIVTYIPAPTAAPGVQGVTPGDIHIHAKSGQGKLFIFSEGGNGGNGEKGKPGANGGDSGQVLVEIDDPTGIQIHPFALPGQGGAPGEGSTEGSGSVGQPGPMCFKLGSGIVGDCDAFSSSNQETLTK